MKPSRPAIIKIIHRLAEGIWTCNLDQIYGDPKGSWYRLARKKTDQQIVHGAVLNTTGPRSVKIGIGVK